MKTSCEDNLWKFPLNCTFLIFSFSSATFLDRLFFASFNLCSFFIWSICNKEDIYARSVLEFICLIGELVVWHLKSKLLVSLTICIPYAISIPKTLISYVSVFYMQELLCKCKGTPWSFFMKISSFTDVEFRLCNIPKFTDSIIYYSY